MAMSSKNRVRLLAADAAAALTLILAASYFLNFYGALGPNFAAKGASIFAIVLSIVAFVLCVRIKSYPVAGMLILGGILMQIPPVQAIAEAGGVSFPGPILGVIFFAPLLVLGLVKAALNPRRQPTFDRHLTN
jgi:hypothetical protein